MPPATSFNPSLRPGGCHFLMRQQPREALVTTEGKEKARKPIDPPPVLELLVDQSMDPHQQFYQNPYLFVSVTLYKTDKDEPLDALVQKSLTGTLVSSLHRLKDSSNKEGGFFVFGDISVRVLGSYRLHFSLYELQTMTNEVQYLGCVDSQPFRVVAAKDFKGMEESTYLSRVFSDQGVRLRLRKEPRGMMNNKRSYSYGESQNQLHSGAQNDKRQKTDGSDDKIATIPAPNYNATYTPGLAYAASSWYNVARPNFSNANNNANSSSSSSSSSMAMQPASFEPFPSYTRPPSVYSNGAYQTPTYPTPTFQSTIYQNPAYQATDDSEY